MSETLKHFDRHTIALFTETYSSGVYNLKFRTTYGDNFSRKLVITK